MTVHQRLKRVEARLQASQAQPCARTRNELDAIIRGMEPAAVEIMSEPMRGMIQAIRHQMEVNSR